MKVTLTTIFLASPGGNFQIVVQASADQVREAGYNAPQHNPDAALTLPLPGGAGFALIPLKQMRQNLLALVEQEAMVTDSRIALPGQQGLPA